jgi:hypothetical protein
MGLQKFVKDDKAVHLDYPELQILILAVSYAVEIFDDDPILVASEYLIHDELDICWASC